MNEKSTQMILLFTIIIQLLLLFLFFMITRTSCRLSTSLSIVWILSNMWLIGFEMYLLQQRLHCILKQQIQYPNQTAINIFIFFQILTIFTTLLILHKLKSCKSDILWFQILSVINILIIVLFYTKFITL